MAQIQRKYNFVNGTRTNAEDVDEELDNLVQGVNTLDNDVQNHKASNSHDGRYYTKELLNQGQLDTRYHTKTELENGKLDSRYYSKTELDNGKLNTLYYIKSETDSQISKALVNAPTSKFIEVGLLFPLNPSKGQAFFHESEQELYIYDGFAWIPTAPFADKINQLRDKFYKYQALNELQKDASSRIVTGDTFGSTFDTSFGMSIDFTKTTAVGTLAIGQTDITVDSTSGFKVGQEITVYDDVNLERVVISAIVGDVLTVSALTKAYKDNANVARSMAVADATNQALKFGGWGNFTTNTVTDATVVNQAYDTSGNGGRKLVRLDNGTLVSVLKNGTSSYHILKSQDDGLNWTEVFSASVTLQDVALASSGERVYFILAYTNNTVKVWEVDLVSNSLVNAVTVDSSQSAIGNVSLTINVAGTELHAAWASKNATYPNSFNIRYAKGVINADGSVTWGSVEQVTTRDTSGLNFEQPSLVVHGVTGNPHILCRWNNTYILDISADTPSKETTFISWNNKKVYNGATAAETQSSPSAIFVPQSVNGLANGRIWVAWHGTDSTSSIERARYSYSDDGGVTWSPVGLVRNDGVVSVGLNPSITSDANGNVFVLYDNGQTAIYEYRRLSTESSFTRTQLINVSCTNPSTLYDPSFDFDSPLFIYKGSTKVGFYGTWTVGSKVPLLENDVRFTTKDTDEIVTWVQRDAGLTVGAELNGVAMTKETVENEDQFVGSLTSVQPIEVKLSLSRASVDSDVKVTKILGGIS
jgi:hypothetical protein